MAQTAKSALLILDMLNTFDFPEGGKLHPFALKAAENILRLKKRFRRKNYPVIYLNDNYEIWSADWKRIYEKCTRDGCMGKDVAERMRPAEGDHFILKPKHSGFYETSLEVLLEQLKIRKLVLTGIAGNICVLFTANDAHMREYEVVVPKDCIGSNTKKDNDYALHQFESVFKFRTPLARNLRL